MQISKFKLDNGIGCLAIKDLDCPSVTITILVKNGSRYESQDKSGIAHLIEHMIFKGTKKRPTSKIIAFDVELLGGMMNAFTSYEYTGFYLKVPKKNHLKAIEILADFFQYSLFDNNELNKEKRVIFEEIKMYEDIPTAKIEQEFLKIIFKDHPLGRNIAGNNETLLKMTSEDCLNYVKNNYCIDNLLIVVSGNFNLLDIKKALNKQFSFSRLKKSVNVFDPAQRIKLPQKIIKFKKDIEQTHVVMGGFLEKRDQEKKIPLLLGNYILSGGFGSKLFQKIREDLGLVYYIGLDASQFKDIGYYSINFGLDNNKVDIAIEKIKKELKDFLKGKVSSVELERAKNFWIGNLVSKTETSEALASWYGVKYLLDKKIIPLKKVIEDINKTGIHNIVNEWEKYFTDENMMIITLGRDR